MVAGRPEARLPGHGGGLGAPRPVEAYDDGPVGRRHIELARRPVHRRQPLRADGAGQ